jgi:hypothetical protein
MGDDEAEGLRPWLLHPRRGQGSPLSLRVLTGGAGHRANTKGSTGQCPSELRSERRDGSAFAVGRRSTRSVGTPPEGGAPTGSGLTVSRGGVRAGRHTAHRGCHRARPISWYVCWKPAGGPRKGDARREVCSDRVGSTRGLGGSNEAPAASWFKMGFRTVVPKQTTVHTHAAREGRLHGIPL